MDDLLTLDPLGILGLMVLIAARLAPIVVLAPFFGASHTPTSIRLAIAGALTLLMTTLVWPFLLSDLGGEPRPWTSWAALAFKELLIGATLAMMVSAVLWAAQTAGALIDRLRGHPSLDPAQSPTSQLTLLLAAALFLISGGHLVLLAALARSFQILPPFTYPTLTDNSGFPIIINLLSELFILAAALSLPIAVVLLLADVALAFIERTTPYVSQALGHLSLRAVLGLLLLFVIVRIALDATVGGTFDAIGTMDNVMDAIR